MAKNSFVIFSGHKDTASCIRHERHLGGNEGHGSVAGQGRSLWKCEWWIISPRCKFGVILCWLKHIYACMCDFFYSWQWVNLIKPSPFPTNCEYSLAGEGFFYHWHECLFVLYYCCSDMTFAVDWALKANYYYCIDSRIYLNLSKSNQKRHRAESFEACCQWSPLNV